MQGMLVVLFLPLAGTAAGSALVWLFKDQIPVLAQKTALGFAAGIMVSASLFSLLLPAMEDGGLLAAAAGFLAGMFFLLLLDKVIPHIHAVTEEEEGPPSSWKKTTRLFLAVTLHNFPEGMAVGVLLAGAGRLGLPAALAFSAGIALQNVPEGAVLSLPLHAKGMSRGKAFLYGTLSGVVEPAGALLMLAAGSAAVSVLPWMLAFSAGAMLYVVVEELIPESAAGGHSNAGTVAFAIGFVLMMILDTVV